MKGKKETSVETGVEEKRHQQMKLSRSCRGTIQQKLKRSSIDPPTVEIAIEIEIRNSLRSQQIGQVSRRCRGCLKTIFQEAKHTDMNAIKHATQLMIQSTF